MNHELLVQLYMDKPFIVPSMLMTSYKKIGMTETQFMVLMHIQQFSQEGNFFPTPNELQARMSIDEKECTNQLKELLKKGFLSIEERQEEDGRLSEAFSVKPLYEKMVLFLNNSLLDSGKKTKQIEEGQLFRRFEEEFSRPLSPMEMEMISMWLDDDGHTPQVIEAALRESVVSSKLNFRYIDRILFDWKNNGIKTLQQAREHGERIRHHQLKKTNQYTGDDKSEKKTRHPHYNWLKN
ncbi:DnaD domain-containing protein [Evansella tamaricis]|nr:DnaD domain-containing protein [Evansella tamaricis]